MTISRCLLRIRSVSNKSCRENQNTHFMFSDFLSEGLAVYEIMSKNMMEPERTRTVWHLRVAYWISKPTRAQAHARARTPSPTHTHTRMHAHIRMPSPTHARARMHTYKYVILIAFHGNWFCERASILRYTYIASLVCSEIDNKHACTHAHWVEWRIF